MMKKLFFIGILAVVVIGFDIALTLFYPDMTILKKHNPKSTAFIEYRKKQWKNEGIARTVSNKWVPLKRISPYLVKAVIISEDDKFWSHEGFDFDAIQKAIEKDIAEKKFKVGGSTISQQLSKNLFLSPSKNPIRKIKEAILTWRMEQTLSKKRIVELYLNVAEWGDGIFGIEAAALHYYGKHAASLGPDEAVHLASVLPNPIVFNPVSNSKFVRKRSAAIYRIMIRRGIVIPEFEEVMKAPDEIMDETPVDILDNGPVTPDPDTPSEETGPDRPSSDLNRDTSHEDTETSSEQKVPPSDTPSPSDDRTGSDDSRQP
jgi:monofunctional biosynthetic peptidoglycan transglycosylase